MRTFLVIAGLSIMQAAAMPAMAEAMRSKVAFNTAIQKPAATQPEGGMAATWDVQLTGGQLDGRTANIAENLSPRDTGSWGIFELQASGACAKGAFKFNTTGSWDQNGFHGAGFISEEGRSGDFAEAKGRVAQIGGRVVPAAAAGTFDVNYELIVERTDK